ncbi:MAG TPA: hypothetical protein H9881_07320 [Candidatus Stackebrandtia excrementipullorum]|nr:hypothetical protein [Candidatus Stackebrandtia excrementipullorum]
MVREDPSGDGGFPAPDATVDYQTVSIDVNSVAAFGDLLKATATNIGNATPGVTELLKDPEGKYASGSPIGRDPRQERLHAIGVDHSVQMEQMTTLLRNVRTGIENLGSLTHFVLNEFGGQDGINEAAIHDVNVAINQRYPNVLGPQA